MSWVSGSFEIGGVIEFRNYDDLENYTTRAGVKGVILGEDARDFTSFYAVEARQPFKGAIVRIGMILASNQRSPLMCSLHGNGVVAIGMNNTVQVIDLNSCDIISRMDVDSVLHHIMCNNNVLVAVHELGASVMQLGTYECVADLDCDIVADATLTDEELVIVSMDDEVVRCDLKEFYRR